MEKTKLLEDAIKTVSMSCESAINLLSFDKSYKRITKADLLEHCLKQRVEILALKSALLKAGGE